MRNWWGTAWVEKMERLAESHRFAEGEKYARTGCVPSTAFDGRTITARVAGRQEPSYIVRISIDPFSEEQWRQLLAEVRDRAGLAKQIESGDLPLELGTAYSKAGLRFMPERYTDLHLECGCPDWLKPCRHLVAGWMKFARDFDRDPFLVFELRGLKRHDLIAMLRNRLPAPVAARQTDEGIPEVVVPVIPEALPADPEAFWAAPALPVALQEAGERSIGDDDVFEKLRDWPKLEYQFSQIYDAVYELATRIRK
jgi:uncharacterized Zn finger protein